MHSAMETPCTVCHLEQTQGDMTMVSLAMPKEQICSACHQASTVPPKHSSDAKGRCLDCHDPHRSDRRQLLRNRIAGFTGGMQGAEAKR